MSEIIKNPVVVISSFPLSWTAVTALEGNAWPSSLFHEILTLPIPLAEHENEALYGAMSTVGLGGEVMVGGVVVGGAIQYK